MLVFEKYAKDGTSGPAITQVVVQEKTYRVEVYMSSPKEKASCWGASAARERKNKSRLVQADQVFVQQLSAIQCLLVGQTMQLFDGAEVKRVS